MSTSDTESANLMILRAWIEPDHEPPLRVRMTRIALTDTSRPVVTAAATVDAACSAVRTWLEQLLEGQQLPILADSTVAAPFDVNGDGVVTPGSQT